MSVRQATTGIGMAGLTLGIMAAFGVAMLVIIFVFHSALDALYAFSTWSHIPFLIVLAWPVWIIAPVGLIGRWLKHVSRSRGLTRLP